MGMKITRIRVENYRSIKECDFEPSMLCALIGGNNTGKSNILRAVDLLLGERWPGVNSFDERDHYQYDVDNDINISVWFDETKEVRGDIGDPQPVNGIRFTLTHYKVNRGNHQKGDPRSVFVCIDNSGNTVQVLRQPRGAKKPYPQDANVTSEIRDSIPAVFIDVDRSSSFHLSGSPRSILGRLLGRVSKELKSDQERFDEFREKFEVAREVLRTPAFEKLEAAVIENLRAHTGLDGVNVTMDDVDPINVYRSFSILFQDSNTAHPVDAERMGSGIQSAVVISLLQAYRELNKDTALLLFEEPELFLHPHGRRHLFRLLCALEAKGTQVLYTTHSQDLVDLERIDSVRIVGNDRESGTQAIAPLTGPLTADHRKRLKMAKHFGAPRNEVFFADTVVLVEGVTEQTAIRILADLRPSPVGLDRLNCSVLEVGGKPALPLMIDACRSLRKNVLVVYDSDSHHAGTDNEAGTNDLNGKIESSCAHDNVITFVFDPYLEAQIGLEGGRKRDKEEKLRAFLERVDSWDDVPKELRDLLDIVALVLGEDSAPGETDAAAK